MSEAESRVTKRQRVLKSAKVIFNHNQSVLDCTVRDISVTGARLVMANADLLPDTIRFLLTQENVIRDANVVWRRGQLVGIHFTSDAVRAPARKF
jgi:PilZ domain